MNPSRLGFTHALLDVTRGDGTIGADVVGIDAGHLAEHGPADFHRVRVVLGLDAPSPVVPGAALDGVQGRARHELQRFAGFLAHVLDPRVARNVVGHLAEAGLEIRLEEAIAMAQDEVLKRVEHGLAHGFHLEVLGKQQRQLALEHEGARRHRREDGVPLPRDLRERGNVQRLEALDRLEIAELELGHAAARLLLYDRIGDLVVIQHSEQIVAYTRLVVVYIAGRKYRHLPRGAFPVFRLVELARPRPRAEGPGAVGRQAAFAVNTDCLLHKRARGRIAVDRIHHLRDDRNRGQLPYRVG